MSDLFDIFCSAGVGRTGCFIAASVGIEEIKVCIYLQQFDSGHLPPKKLFLSFSDQYMELNVFGRLYSLLY